MIELCPIHHVAIEVQDMDTALAFFQNVFGMTVTRTAGPKDAPDNVWLDGGVQLCRVDRQKADCGRINHLSFHCTDLEGVLARAAQYGAQPIPGKARHWFSALGIPFEIK